MSKKVIVFGNEKGGTGKSTLAMHLVVNLLNQGHKVGTIDVDAKQGTFSRYIENRTRTHDEGEKNILLPTHRPIFFSGNAEENKKNFSIAMDSLLGSDYIVVDTPGHDNDLSRFAHSFADILITPMNESFIDLDLLVRLRDSLNKSELKPSSYAEMVWEQKKNKAVRNRGSIDWIVLINRMSNIASKNRQELEKVLIALSKRIGFRFAKGFKERVIFRELFLSGLTLLDKNATGMQISLSHIAARHELADLIEALKITSDEKIVAA
ncbi:MAG: division plane positioning ATPase MipZ [Holosporales bacterium]|jgi:chromosome partitioning protein|nr:division plane positioning ATPase MipZ [Holosporales bacterium]